MTKEKRIKQMQKMAEILSDWLCENPEAFSDGIYFHVETALDCILRLKNWLISGPKPETEMEKLERLLVDQPKLLALLKVDLGVFDGNDLLLEAVNDAKIDMLDSFKEQFNEILQK